MSSSALIICLDCSVRTLSHRSGRCTDCRRRQQRAKDATPARQAQKSKYDAAHRAHRKVLAAQLAAGIELRCWRCDGTIEQPDELHLGHRPGQESAAECRGCNLAASNEGRRQ